MTDSIVRRVTAQVMDLRTGRGSAMAVDLRYEPDDPFAVFLDIRTRPVTPWMFARDVLDGGTRSPHGAGDVVVSPHPFDSHVVIVDLSTPEGCGPKPGHAVLHLDIVDVAKFLADTFAAVPAGQESALIDWDAEFGKLGAA